VKRVPTAELLDSDAGTPAEIAASLNDLEFFNRCFGGVSTTASMVARIAESSARHSLSFLEVASGSGYVAAATCQQLKKRGVQLDITLSDRSRSHLRNGNRAVAADALALPFRECSFDVVSCNLFAHHLAPPDLQRFTDEALRVCRIAVLINDLIRQPLHLALVYAGMPLYRSRLTRHDAPASVRQAYTPEEMEQLLGNTTAGRVEIQSHYLFRMGVIVWKRNSNHNDSPSCTT
jgi:ubiquinone/menaquinone biosynthesis C-methylase UbiE